MQMTDDGGILWDSTKAIETGFAGIQLFRGEVVKGEKIVLPGKPEYGGKDKERFQIDLINVEILKTTTPIEMLKMPEDGSWTVYIPYSTDKRFFWTKCFLPAYEQMGIKLPDGMYAVTVFQKRKLPLGGGFDQNSYVPVIVGDVVAKGFDLDKEMGEVAEAEEVSADEVALELADGKTAKQLAGAAALNSTIRKDLKLSRAIRDGSWVEAQTKAGKLAVVRGVIKVK